MLSDHVVFPILLSKDLDASRSFYRDTLGLEIIREDPDDRIVFRCGGGTQLVVTLSTVGTSDTQTQLAWRVPDIHAALADLYSRWGEDSRALREYETLTRIEPSDDTHLVGACIQCHGPITSFDLARADYDGDGVVEGIQSEVEGLLNELALMLPPIGLNRLTANWPHGSA